MAEDGGPSSRTHTSIGAATGRPSARVVDCGFERSTRRGVDSAKDAIATVLGVIDTRWGAGRGRPGHIGRKPQMPQNASDDIRLLDERNEPHGLAASRTREHGGNGADPNSTQQLDLNVSLLGAYDDNVLADRSQAGLDPRFQKNGS